MKIDYRLTVDDYLRYQRYTREHTPEIRHSMWRRQFLPGIGIMLLVPAVTGGFTDAVSLFMGLCLGGLWIALYPWLRRRADHKLILAAFRDRDDFSGDYRLELTDAGLVEAGPGLTISAEWRMIHKVAVDRTNIYIYLSALQAAIVPLEAFRDIMLYNEFLAKLAAGTGLPLDILKVNEQSGPNRPVKRRRRFGGAR